MRRSTANTLANTLIVALLLAGSAAGAHAATAVTDSHRPAADVARDADRKPLAMLEFAHIGHGVKVADFIPGGGYWTRLFAVAVKPGGSVVAIVPAAARQLHADEAAGVDALATNPAYGDISVVASPLDPAAQGLDVFYTAQNYHDLHNLPAGVVEGLNKAIFAAVKPGGYYVVIDHAAAAGAPADVTKTLHRIDPAVVKAEVMAAGFTFDGESAAVAAPGDDHSKNVFDPAIRGHTDQFAYRFRKPK